MTDDEKLYRTYYMQVYSYVMTLAENKELAEEITQTVFYKAITTQSHFRNGSGELTWLCAIAKNTFYDEMRRQKPEELPQEEMCSGGDDIEKAVMDDDTAYRIHLILHRLDEPYKEVFSLRVFGELPFSKIGAIFCKTESWARVTYHRARLKIKERMDFNE